MVKNLIIWWTLIWATAWLLNSYVSLSNVWLSKSIVASFLPQKQEKIDFTNWLLENLLLFKLQKFWLETKSSELVIISWIGNKYVHWKTYIFVQAWTRLLLFGTFETAMSKPIKKWKTYIPQKKALLPIVWKKFWNWKNFCHGGLQTSFSRSGSFLNHFY